METSNQHLFTGLAADQPIVKTNRLTMFPLTGRQLVVYLQADNVLERQLGLHITNRNMSPTVKEHVEASILPTIALASETDYVFHTFWIIIANSCNTIVAEMGFKGGPDGQGQVELGYGTMPGYEGNGYMTEAVAGILRWAEDRQDVNAVLLSIDRANKASLRIAAANHFECYAEENNMLWWRRNVGKY